MFGLPRNAGILWLLVASAAIAALGASTVAALRDLRLAPAVLLFAVAGAIAESFRVTQVGSRPGHHVETTVSSAVYVAAALVFPLHWAVLAVAAAVAVSQLLVARVTWFKAVFNISQFALSAGVGALVWRLAAPEASVLRPESVPWLVGALAAYFVTNTLLVSAIVSLAAGVPVRLTWWRWNRGILPTWLGMLFVGVLIAVLWTVSPWTVALAVVPLAALYYALRNSVTLQTQTIDALFRLADILDARDTYTHGHSLRVGEYAERLALALGRSGDEAYLVFLAGRLHDIGKSAVKHEILLKPGPLDFDERDHMRTHAAVGGLMLGHFTLFEEVAKYVRSHHERWDGGGYPDGLKGEAIPLGARVIAVVDAYDAMTTTRPYRAALPHEEAMRRLREGAGTQWDAQVVAAFIRVVEEEGPPAAVPVVAPASPASAPLPSVA